MARFAPFASDRRVAVAVSGGADSLALAILVRQWARGRSAPLGLVIDHAQRPGSAADAARARDTLVRFGIPARVLALDGLAPGPALHERARLLRYAMLTEACRQAGIVDLLLGHHRADQAETVIMRGRAGSGPDGQAGMAALSERNMVRLLRPLLGVAPDRLRATLLAASVGWVEDPANVDLRFGRARLRREFPGGMPMVDGAARPATARARGAEAAAAWLARHAIVREEGCVVLPPGRVPAAVLSRVIQSVSGRAHPPPLEAVARLAADPAPATLHGARLLAAGRFGRVLGERALLVVREAAAMAPPVPARDGAVWDGRFRLRCRAGREWEGEGWRFGAPGPGRAGGPGMLPAAVRAGLPALIPPDGRPRIEVALGGGELSAIFSPAVPIAPSFFTLDCDDR